MTISRHGRRTRRATALSCVPVRTNVSTSCTATILYVLTQALLCWVGYNAVCSPPAMLLLLFFFLHPEAPTVQPKTTSSSLLYTVRRFKVGVVVLYRYHMYHQALPLDLPASLLCAEIFENEMLKSTHVLKVEVSPFFLFLLFKVPRLRGSILNSSKSKTDST